MIRQHEDAIAIAEVENAGGEYPYAVALANTVMVGQASQVRTMELMLGAERAACVARIGRVGAAGSHSRRGRCLIQVGVVPGLGGGRNSGRPSSGLSRTSHGVWWMRRWW